MKNYFSILQVSNGASLDEIRTSYRALSKKYHPDVNKSPDAHDRFCEITEAYDFLMHHWQEFSRHQMTEKDLGNHYRNYQQADVYEKFRYEARERAKRQAKMRYDKFRKQHEAFQESGINDIGLILTIFFRFISVPLFLFFFLAPLIATFFIHWSWIFTILFMWPFAIGLAWHYHDKRKKYFFPGTFYYNFNRVKHLFTDLHLTSVRCSYSKNRLADSRPYKLELLKLKDVKFKTSGFRQHNVNYINQSHTILIPRSRKAFIIHSICIILKVFSLIGSIFFLNITSMVWRVIIGFLIGAFLTRLLLILSRTKSNITYLYNYGLLIRLIMWMTAIILASRFYLNPFDIQTSDIIYFIVTVILISDAFIMQLLNLLLHDGASVPFINQYYETTLKFKEGYTVYNDVPVISIIYPIFRWIFG